MSPNKKSQFPDNFLRMYFKPSYYKTYIEDDEIPDRLESVKYILDTVLNPPERKFVKLQYEENRPYSEILELMPCVPAIYAVKYYNTRVRRRLYSTWKQELLV